MKLLLMSHCRGAISGFRPEVVMHAVLVYYAVYSGNFLPTFRENLSVALTLYLFILFIIYLFYLLFIYFN